MKLRLVQIGIPLALVALLLLASAHDAARAALEGKKSRDVAAETAALETQVAQLAHQIQNAADYVAINNLQDSYGYYVDKTKWDEVTDLFTDDGSVEIGLRGVYKGKERVRAYMYHLGHLNYGTLFNHSQLQPVVHIDPDGLHAHGRFRAYMQVGVLNSRAQWGDAVYENDYRKENGIWKIERLHAYFIYYVGYTKGWDQGGDPPPPPLKDLPPDSPTTFDYKLYPDVYVPPFHYKNLVTGR
jgi:hypothetical protein